MVELLTIAFPLLLFLIDGTLAGKSRREARIEACSRDPSLAFCREFRSAQGRSDGDKVFSRIIFRKFARKKACSSLEREYEENCDALARRRDEFCAAYENVCFHNKNRDDNEGDPNGGDAEQTGSAENNDRRRIENESPSPKDYIEFCKNYKQRFLYVCPDPVRFGSRAAVFCPIYSERCQLPLPERPILPPSLAGNNNMNPMRKICGQYRNFAVSYCGNPLALQYTNVREQCDKYQRFCNNANNIRQPMMMVG
ncbi:hypothetical protein M3Y97_00573400 [Aphelenchoides bicaudatus]|nr:hypothetical protein M3Y97_00573400 [Aphelenchoides bicaudatus]